MFQLLRRPVVYIYKSLWEHGIFMTAIKQSLEVSQSHTKRGDGICWFSRITFRSWLLVSLILSCSRFGHAQKSVPPSPTPIPLKGFVQTFKAHQPVGFTKVGIHGVEFK